MSISLTQDDLEIWHEETRIPDVSTEIRLKGVRKVKLFTSKFEAHQPSLERWEGLFIGCRRSGLVLVDSEKGLAKWGPIQEWIL